MALASLAIHAAHYVLYASLFVGGMAERGVVVAKGCSRYAQCYPHRRSQGLRASM